MKTASPVATKWLGLFNRKERWGFSWRGWLVFMSILVVLAYGWLRNVSPFLAVTERTDSKILVVEGWVHEFAARTAATEFQTGGYQQVFVTGVPVAGSGAYVADSDTEAYVGAGLLKRAGIPDSVMERVPRRKLDRDRTYGSALALKAWFTEHHLAVTRINIVTESAHARRTRRLFQEALGPEIQVGIIAAANPDYDARHWWRYSEGVREILGESLAYLYAVFIFRPDPA